MKLEKVTDANGKLDDTPPKRWYDDGCGTALALEFFGERWSLLIMRELMLGPRRFGELKANLAGISANVLTQRLESLERSKIVARSRLPPPANAPVYGLTPWGYEAEPIFQTMGRWATRSPLHDPTLPLSPVSAMLSLRTMIATNRPPLAMTIGFCFPTDAFVGRLDADELHIERGTADAVDASFATDPTTFVTLVYGKRPFEDAEREGSLTLTGDRDLARRFVELFALPPRHD